METDKRAALEEHLRDCYVRLAVAMAPGARSTIEFVIEHLEAELAMLARSDRTGISVH